MVKRVLNLVYSEIRGLHQAAYILAIFAFGSQLLALVRDRLLAHTFGASNELDLYYAAFRIPDVLFVIFVSVLSVYVLLPFVTKARESVDARAGAFVLGQMFTLFLIGYTSIAVVIFFIAPFIVPIFFPGLIEDSEALVGMMRILLIQPMLLGVSSLFGVVTQLSHRFVLYAISPLIYNIGIIFGIILLYPYYGVYGLVWGVVIGALGHMLVQLPLVTKSELAFGLVRNFDRSLIKSIVSVALPRAITLSLHQIVLLVLVGVATLMSAGSVSVFQFALNLQSVPLVIIGMSYSVAAFPVLADLFAKKEIELFNNHLLTAFRHIVFWSFPIIALVLVLRAQIVRVVLGSGEFSWSDTRLTAAILALFIVSLTAQSLLLLLVRGFYAAGKTRIPLFVALFGAFVSIVAMVSSLKLIEIYPYLHTLLKSLFRVGDLAGTEVLILGAAFVVGILVEVVIMFVVTTREFNIKWNGLLPHLGISTTASLVAAMVSYGTLNFVVEGINQETFVGIMIQGGIAGVLGLFGALITYRLFGSKELDEIYKSFRSKLFKSKVVGMPADSL